MLKVPYEEIKNKDLRKDIRRYLRTFDTLYSELRKQGINVADTCSDTSELKSELVSLNVKVRNDGKGFVWGEISPSCLHCRTGEKSETFIISLKCNRDCYFCANKNQQGYSESVSDVRDIKAEFDTVRARLGSLLSVGITGGEPLLFIDECISFIEHVKLADSSTQIRLYTNGDLANEAALSKLSDAGLDEIRFGLKFDENGTIPENLYDNLKAAVKHINRTMIEMPVMPGSYDEMKIVMDRAEVTGVFSFNLLEFLFPWNNKESYSQKGFKIKRKPYRVLYGYDYAGGLPVDGSEKECLRLLKYAAENNFKTGVHYCSLENKLTAQVWQRNSRVRLADNELFSHNDFFIKTAKAYGKDAVKVMNILEKAGLKNFHYVPESRMTEFSVSDIRLLDKTKIELGISSAIVEKGENGWLLREVAIDGTDSKRFSTEDILGVNYAD